MKSRRAEGKSRGRHGQGRKSNWRREAKSGKCTQEPGPRKSRSWRSSVSTQPRAAQTPSDVELRPVGSPQWGLHDSVLVVRRTAFKSRESTPDAIRVPSIQRHKYLSSAFGMKSTVVVVHCE